MEQKARKTLETTQTPAGYSDPLAVPPVAGEGVRLRWRAAGLLGVHWNKVLDRKSNQHPRDRGDTNPPSIASSVVRGAY